VLVEHVDPQPATAGIAMAWKRVASNTTSSAGEAEALTPPGRYVTEQGITSKRVNVPTGAAKEFDAYDPEREVVFLFDDGTGIATYRGAPSGQPSPRQLHEMAHRHRRDVPLLQDPSA
jgi:hypothetical protein